ncbi:hypothetical protein ACJIZ3_013816 [Penstemon smallii]|uniref:Uncharacterized protein n=1 Tax=Penstemon smallii TaxID=265156 RepID=A0ABD3RI39_9LAMI
MATQLNPTFSRATSRAAIPPPHNPILRNPLLLFAKEQPCYLIQHKRNKYRTMRNSRIFVVNEGEESYLDMWKKAVDRERKSVEFERIAENSVKQVQGKEESDEDFERRNNEFKKLLEVSSEERDKVQRMQVIDRAAAAIAAAKALLKENKEEDSTDVRVAIDGEEIEDQEEGLKNVSSFSPQSGSSSIGTPGPSFWSWTPPANEDGPSNEIELKPSAQASPSPSRSNPILEKERGLDFLTIPFQSSMLPPLQSHDKVEKLDQKEPHLEEENELGVQFSAHAAEAAEALSEVNEVSTQGVNVNGSRWWKETGIEQRPDGVLCKWTLIRGVSSDEGVEWENKYWEAADEFGYKELGSEKSGRDAVGNVWREYWRESMVQNEGVVNIEKTADKWGKNIQGDEWQEKWWEHYGASGQVEKWAHKWCSIDPNTPVDDGHAHVWHERWGEKYDGQGGSTKYTDKWAERFEGDGWAKWGDKWDENFDPNGHGVKQGETWWQGKYGDRWNRTWGEGHNGSGWVHKYGKSSSGEHWDTHEPQETWYERFPHYGFYHCFENSVQLREVEKPSEWDSNDL